MTRTNWFDTSTDLPLLNEQVQKLESLTQAMADGIIAADEIAAQEARLVAAMKAAEGLLNDEQHAAVTAVLLELSAYNIMATMHETQQMRLKAAFS